MSKAQQTCIELHNKILQLFFFFVNIHKTKKCLLNAVLQYLQPTEFYTPVSTTVLPTCTYGSTECSETALFRCCSFAYLHAYFANVFYK